MIGNAAICAKNLSKRYRIGLREPYNTFREAITGAISHPIKRLLHNSENSSQYFWALKDVSFKLEYGEVLGVIGSNGSGKSTLLKILSRITTPTEGSVEIHGRIGSLLEVGTGFHPELTGRENIYLSGTILGMRKREIDEKFDEITKFSEIERFLDTPVKRYSSGMYVRLAFAVAAHLEPEILLVDEVLAVGDAAFQKKCLGKMGTVAREGRTILFVSHNMAAVQHLCSRCMLLNNGKIMHIGETKDIIAEYISHLNSIKYVDLLERDDRSGDQSLKFTKVVICNTNGSEINQVISGMDISIKFYYRSSNEIRNAYVMVSFNVKTEIGYILMTLNSIDSGNDNLNIFKEGFFECQWPKVNLKSGSYNCNLFCSINGNIVDWIQNAFTINVESGDFYGTGRLIDRSHGDILVSHSWKSIGT